MDSNACKVFHSQDHQDWAEVASASCFYFPPLIIGTFLQQLFAGKLLAMRAGRIEVTDQEGPLHWHNGITLVFIASGFGCFKTQTGDVPVQQGDWIYIPPLQPHLSIAAKNTTMIEQIVFLGEASDLQAARE